VAVVLLLAHASVDYALRTTDLMAVFAWAVAMIMSPVGTLVSASPRAGQRTHSRSAGSRTRGPTSSHARAAEPQSMPPQDPTEASDRAFVPAPPRDDWPAAWRVPPPSPDD
jgi:hypothetical protein